MTPFEVADEDRAAYHAAASVASNLLVALEGAAERLAATAGVPREALAPLVRASVENWARARRAARADRADRARRRGDRRRCSATAIAERAPELLPLFDVLGERGPRARRTARTPAAAADRAHDRRAARAARRGAPRTAARSGSSRRWARCTTGTSR